MIKKKKTRVYFILKKHHLLKKSNTLYKFPLQNPKIPICLFPGMVAEYKNIKIGYILV